MGELSALNAFAGSYAEQVPVIHLVGVPSTRATKAGKIMHHTLGPNHSPETFPLMYKSCTVAQVLINERTTAEEIDGAIELCIRRNQPIYIALPQDLVNMPLPLVALDRKIDTRQPQNWAAVEEIVIDHIVKLLSDSKKAVILADAGAARDHAKGEVDLLVQTLKNVPVFTTAMGKGSINENIPNFAGVYCGNLSLESVEASFKSADLIIAIGLIETDMNTGMFTFNFDGQKVVELHAQYTLVRGGKFDQVGLKNMLPKLIEALAPLDIKSDVEIPGNLPLPRPLMSTDATKLVSYPFFWSQIEQWLRPNDIIFSEAGTCGFGILDVKLPPAATVSAQFLWASIGFGTAALCGAACANKGRVIGFLGDGAFMMSFQEISTMIRYHCSDVVLFLMNNSGYTVEKYLHGVDKKYNSVNSGWRFTDTLHYFGGDRESSWCVNNEQMLVDLLRHPNFLDRKGIKVIASQCRTTIPIS